MAFEIIAEDGEARTGILRVKGKEIETPFFMPVATKTAVKHISTHDLEDMGAKAVISNAFILSLRPGTKIIKDMGGITKFMAYSGINFTDSGGFQMYSPALYVESKENGVVFKDPFAGGKKFISPENDMDIQLDIGSDVAMCLDTMPLIEHSKDSITEAVRKTINWAKICKEYHDGKQKDIPNGKRQLLFGIIQGGIHAELREKCASELLKLNFDGYSIGGLALGETKEEEYEMIEVVKKIIPKENPIYLMGAGNPLELLEAIARGVDMFDSRFPTKSGRRGALFTWQGRIRITNKKYSTDESPIDPECDCFVCQRYSKSYLRYLVRQEEGAGMRLVSYHNLYFLQRLMEKAREHIKGGTFKLFLEDFREKYRE